MYIFTSISFSDVKALSKLRSVFPSITRAKTIQASPIASVFLYRGFKLSYQWHTDVQDSANNAEPKEFEKLTSHARYYMGLYHTR